MRYNTQKSIFGKIVTLLTALLFIFSSSLVLASEVLRVMAADERGDLPVGRRADNPYGFENSVSRGLAQCDECFRDGISQSLDRRIAAGEKPRVLLVGVGRGKISYDLLRQYGDQIEIYSISLENLFYTPAQLAGVANISEDEAKTYLEQMSRNHQFHNVESGLLFPDGRFGIVVITQATLEYIQNKLELLTEIKRVLERNGEGFADLVSFEVEGDKARFFNALGPEFETFPFTVDSGFSRKEDDAELSDIALHITNRNPENRMIPLELVDSTKYPAPRRKGNRFHNIYRLRETVGATVALAGEVEKTTLRAILRQVSFGERRNVILGDGVKIGKHVTFKTEGSGTIEIHDGARIQNGVQLIAKDGQHIVIGKKTTLLAGFDTIIRGDVTIGERCEISGRVTDATVGDRTRLHDRPVVTMAQIGNDCHINGGEIKGYYVEGRGNETVFEEEKPINIVVVTDGARINKATIRTVKEKHSWGLVKKIDPDKKPQTLGKFPLRNIAVDIKASVIEGRDPESNKETLIERATITNGEIGGGSIVEPEAFVTDASTGRRCRVTSQARLDLTALKDDIRFGAEASKSRLGRGTTAAHRSAYVSVVTHDAIPLVNEEGKVEILDLGANCSGIPAQCTFANLSGEADSNGEPIKGTAHLLGPSFIASGAVIVNLPGASDIPLEEIYEQDDITVLGPFCYVLNKVKGPILPFTKAGEKVEKTRRTKVERVPDISPRFHEIGWVLDNYTGMILDRLLRLKRYANPQAFDSLVERTLVHSINLVKRELAKPESRYDKYKLMRGLEICEAHLYSGAWKMANGNFVWGGKLEKGQDFKALERQIKKKVRSYREQKRQERFKPIKTWIDMFKDKSNPQLEKTLIETYGERPDFIEERRVIILNALEEAAKIFGLNREVCIIRSPARINLCGRGNQDAEDGHMNYLSECRENIMVVAQREGDTNVNLYNATPAFRNQTISFSIAREVEYAQAAWHAGWDQYINDTVVKQRVEDARADQEAEWVNVPRGAILNLIHGLGDLGLFYLNVDINGFDALVYSDIPPGGGISSSSAFAVSSALAFLNTNRLSAVPRESIAMLPYEIYTGELGGNGDHAAITLAKLNQVTHLSHMNSTGSPNADYVPLSGDLQIAIVPSFVSSRKTGEQMIENNKAKFSFKLAVPIIKKILVELRPQYPDIITSDFINNFKYIGQLNVDNLGERYEEIIYKILRRLPDGKTTEQLINEYPYSGLRNLAEKFHLTEEKFTEFDEKHTRKGLFGRRQGTRIDRTVDLKGPVMFFLATAERARMFGEYLKEQEKARIEGRTDDREALLEGIGELMYINHDGDRVTDYDPQTGRSRDFQGRRVTNELLDTLITDLNSGNAQGVAQARLYRQPGYFRASVKELDAIIDTAKGLGRECVVGALFGGAGYGGNAIVLLRKRSDDVDTFEMLKEALGKAKILQTSREEYAAKTKEGLRSLEFARLNIPVAGASAFEISTSGNPLIGNLAGLRNMAEAAI